MSHESWVISLYLNRILFPLQLASRQQAIYSSQSQSVSQSPNIRRPEIEQSWPSLIIPQSSAAQPQWQSQSQASTWSDKSSAAPEKSRTLPSGLTLLGWLGLGWQCATGVGVGVTSLKEPLDFDFRFFIHRFKVFPGFGGVTTTSGDLQITCFFCNHPHCRCLDWCQGPIHCMPTWCSSSRWRVHQPLVQFLFECFGTWCVGIWTWADKHTFIRNTSGVARVPVAMCHHMFHITCPVFPHFSASLWFGVAFRRYGYGPEHWAAIW